jgi:hypothetical protein
MSPSTYTHSGQTPSYSHSSAYDGLSHGAATQTHSYRGYSSRGGGFSGGSTHMHSGGGGFRGGRR